MFGTAYASSLGDVVVRYFDGTTNSDVTTVMPSDFQLLGWNPNTQRVEPFDLAQGLNMNAGSGDFVFVDGFEMSQVVGLVSALTGKVGVSDMIPLSNITNLQLRLDEKGTASLASQIESGQMAWYDKLKLDNLPIYGTSTQADWSATSTLSGNYVKNKPTIPSLQSTRIQTNSTGDYTWTFPTAFGSAPNVIATVETGTTTNSFNVQIVSRSTTSVVVKVYSTVPTNVLGSLLGAAPVAAQAYVHLMATQ